MELDRFKDIRMQGSGKFFHRIVMFITYPLRHFFKFMIFTFVGGVILAAIPMSQGVSSRHIVDWYLLRYNKTANTIMNKIKIIEVVKPTSIVPSNPEDKFKEVSAPKIIRKKDTKDTENVKRRVFRRPPIKLDISEQKAEVSQTPQPPLFDKISYTKNENSNLAYEETPKEIQGTAFVFSANEMAIGNYYIILYGIYINPEKHDEAKAFAYMKELADGKKLTCKIIAYTPDNIATGFCFLDGHSLNKNLIDAGFAENTSL